MEIRGSLARPNWIAWLRGPELASAPNFGGSVMKVVHVQMVSIENLLNNNDAIGIDKCLQVSAL